jgi:hypothetical protein
MQVGEGILRDLRAGSAAQEKSNFRVLDGFGGSLVERSLGARITRFSLQWG